MKITFNFYSKRRLTILFFSFFIICFPCNVFSAQSLTKNITATVISPLSIDSAGDISFGTFQPTSSPRYIFIGGSTLNAQTDLTTQPTVSSQPVQVSNGQNSNTFYLQLTGDGNDSTFGVVADSDTGSRIFVNLVNASDSSATMRVVMGLGGTIGLPYPANGSIENRAATSMAGSQISARLQIGANQKPGVYTGSYTISINMN